MLAREAIRLAVVRGLRGRTWVGDRVHDSEHGPVDDRVAAETLPLVVVYTDDVEGSPEEDSLLAGGTLTLVIEILMTARMKLHAEGSPAEGDYVWDCPQTDAGMELTLGIIERQVRLALNTPGNAWGELWLDLARRRSKISSQRGTSMREGVRFAGRQLTMSIMLPNDPVPGSAPGPIWTRFLDLVDAATDLTPVAPMLRALIDGTSLDLSGADVLRAAYGLSPEVSGALLLEPVASIAPDAPAFAPTPGQVFDGEESAP